MTFKQAITKARKGLNVFTSEIKGIRQDIQKAQDDLRRKKAFNLAQEQIREERKLIHLRKELFQKQAIRNKQHKILALRQEQAKINERLRSI